MVERLSDFPWVSVRSIVPSARTARGNTGWLILAKKYGADIQLCDLMDKIAFDCPWKTHPGERPPNQYDPKCKAGQGLGATKFSSA
jgi:hypothetical protein